VRHLVFFLEEPSAKELLKNIVPRIVPPELNARYLVFRGKQDLEKNLLRRLGGWRLPDTGFVILRDQDSGDCKTIKSGLSDICRHAGREPVLIRVACRELESFYLGDLIAVEKGLGLTGIAGKQNNRKYRTPDRLGSPSRELDRLTSGRYQKMAGSRAIAPQLQSSCGRHPQTRGGGAPIRLSIKRHKLPGPENHNVSLNPATNAPGSRALSVDRPP
jgi:hypothetical protein